MYGFSSLTAGWPPMLDWFASSLEAALLVPLALATSWLARRTIQALTRRAVRRAPRREGGWRVRLDRLGDRGQADVRKQKRADAVARMLGHFVTVAVFALASLLGLELLGVDPVVAISSAGFIGFAAALTGQDLLKDILAGSQVLLEDRFAVGDDVVLRVGGEDVHGTVDLIGTASIRLRTTEGTTWHAGHHSIESVTNLSQLPAVSDIAVPLAEWAAADEDAAAERLAGASNDVGLTGVVFVRDIETYEAGDSDTLTVKVKANRPLTSPEADLVRQRLLDH